MRAVALLAVLLVASVPALAVDEPPPVDSEFGVPMPAPPPDPSAAIAAIIYSDLGKAEMLEQLAAYVRVGDKLQEIPAKAGLPLGSCFTSGPGVAHCNLENGLQLVADPDGVVQVIRRSAREVDGKSFPEMSISTHLLQWNGYLRGYPE